MTLNLLLLMMMRSRMMMRRRKMRRRRTGLLLLVTTLLYSYNVHIFHLSKQSLLSIFCRHSAYLKKYPFIRPSST